MKTSIGVACVLVLVCVGAGCLSEVNSCASWIHQSWTTDKAWRCRKWMYEGIDCGSSFKAGFKAGYRFANCGGDSCQPPGPSHFWFANGMTDEDQREAQAWCDGFTHGTLAAQQDGNTAASMLDAQTAQPPENVPDVYYYPNQDGSNPGEIGSIGSPQSLDPFAPGQPAPNSVSPAPLATGMMPPAPQSLSNGSTAAAPSDVAYPPAAPAAEAIELPIQKGTSTTHYSGSSAFPGIGSLRTMVGPNSPGQLSGLPSPSADRSLNPMPRSATAVTVPPAPGPPFPRSLIPYPPSPSASVAPKGASEAVPSTLPTPSIRVAPAPQWELPIIRD
jgi:hypothetical protein